MSWVSWIIVGFVAGVLAKLVTGRDKPGCLGTIVIGILGGIVGGALFKAAGDEGINGFSVRSMLVAFVGAAILLFVANLLSSNDRS